MKKYLGSFVVSFLLFASAHASNHVGTLTQVEGAVQILTHPSKSAEGPSPRVNFEGTFYTFRDAKIGEKIENGFVVRTLPSGKARLIYENGDQMQMGPGTQYKIEWKGESDKSPKINLHYGKLRSIVSKSGPRNRLQVRTPTATMGVRGTDFFVSQHIAQGGSTVSVIRGKVELAAELAKEKKVSVEAGKSAVVPAIITPVKVVPTTQDELKRIRETSTIAVAPAPAPEIKKLEEKAVQNVIAEIKQEDPKLLAALPTAELSTLNGINQSVVLEQEKVAPKGPELIKQFRDDLRPPSEDVYKKYFKE